MQVNKILKDCFQENVLKEIENSNDTKDIPNNNAPYEDIYLVRKENEYTLSNIFYTYINK